ncbi:MAG: SDR family oxidoreductase [Hyphomicrobiales bacterium]|nr:SDR family oxidoreductase [Hyphomicrobiales bacterium]
MIRFEQSGAATSVTNNPEIDGKAKTHLLIFGFGYSATAIGQKVLGQFDQISVTNRSNGEKRDDRFRHLVFDGIHSSSAIDEAIHAATHILVSVGPDDKGDPVINACLQAVKSATGTKWIGYLSTVGVYGNHDGAWVDENTVCKPVSARSIQRLEAEAGWQNIARQKKIPLAIFRLSGIYGPGRNALVNIEKGRSRRLVKKGQVFNRIHRDDIAIAVQKAIELKADGIFNITDDEPAPPQDVVTYVHQLRGSEPPAEIDFETADLTPMARSFYGENKKVSNAKSKAILKMRYIWPDYRQAFDAMWKYGKWK